MGDRRIDNLKRIELFTACSDKELEHVASRMDEVDVESGRTLIQEGQPVDAFYVLLDGAVDVSGSSGTQVTLDEGDFFGEISMLDRGPATATVKTKEPSRMLVMSHSQFRDAIKSDDQLLSQVLAAVAARLRRDSVHRLAH